VSIAEYILTGTFTSPNETSPLPDRARHATSLPGRSGGEIRVSKEELAIAADLVDRFTGSWKPEAYRDTYRERLREVIATKRKGKEIQVEQGPEREPPEDLLEALRASVEAAKPKRRRPSKRKRATARR
jgi:DNA end-binding protein Ku